MSKSPKKTSQPIDIFRILANPEQAPIAYFFLSFFLIGPVLGIGVNGLSTILFESFCQFLADWSGYSKLTWQLILVTLLVVAVFALLLLFQIPTQLAKLRDRLFGEPQLEVKPLQDSFRGLITLASPARRDGTATPAEASIRHHLNTLEHCWIVCTEGSFPEARRLITKLIDQGLLSSQQAASTFYYGIDYQLPQPDRPDELLNFLLSDRDSDNPNQVRQVIDAIYADARNKGLVEAEIITDYTGGTKSLTAGVILACAVPSRRLQYISQIDESFKEVSLSYKVKPLQQR